MDNHSARMGQGDDANLRLVRFFSICLGSLVFVYALFSVRLFIDLGHFGFTDWLLIALRVLLGATALVVISYPAWFAHAELAELLAPPRAVSATGAAVAAALHREGYDWREQLRALRVPTLVIHGEWDPLPVSVARDTASLIPDTRLAVIPGSGHMPFWEAPERFFGLVEAFLSPGGPDRPPPSS